jgi:hypothetical protein
MTQNRLQNNNINGNSDKYCSKCLSVLGDNKVKDGEGNWFCDEICRNQFWTENRKERDTILREWLRSE